MFSKRHLVALIAISLTSLTGCKKAETPATDTAAIAAADTTAVRTLYDRLGGKDAITAVVDSFVAIVAKDTRINKKFAKSDANRLVKNLTDFVCKATGGPCTYTGRDMKTAHKNMAVTNGEFTALVEDLSATLDKFKVPEKEKGELLAALGPLQPEIVEKKTDATGEPLPKDFKPAPPLKNP